MKTNNIHSTRFLFRVDLAVLVLVFGTIQAASDSMIKKPLFAEADRLLEKAKTINADILAPTAYTNALQSYRKAETEFEKGKNPAAVRRLLNSAALDLE